MWMVIEIICLRVLELILTYKRRLITIQNKKHLLRYPMPIYEYICLDCKEKFETLRPMRKLTLLLPVKSVQVCILHVC